MHSLLFYLAVAAASFSIAQAWQCPCGSYCPDPVLKYKAPVPYPIGFVCPEGLFNKTSSARPCYNGKYCPTTGTCTPLPCPPGFYCPQGSWQPQPCQRDYYCPENSKAQVHILHSDGMIPHLPFLRLS